MRAPHLPALSMADHDVVCGASDPRSGQGRVVGRCSTRSNVLVGVGRPHQPGPQPTVRFRALDGGPDQEGATRDAQGADYYNATDSYYGVYGTVVAAGFRVSAPLTTLEGSAQVTSKLYETRGATVVYTLDTKVRNIESRELVEPRGVIRPAAASTSGTEGAGELRIATSSEM